jgi:hypothetical protein
MIQVNNYGFVEDSEHKVWIPPINKKQFELFNDFHRYLLCTGCRKAGKTIGVEHKVLRHAFDCNGAVIAIITKTIKNAKGSGIWTELTETILPIWLNAGIGMQLAPGLNGKALGVTGDTKMSYVKVTNRYGTVSEIQLHSLEHEREVEAKFKGTRFSLFWLSELDRWDDRFIFDICTDQLRLWPRIPYEQHQLIADCNPPDTGPNNDWHDLWFKTPLNPESPNYPLVDGLKVIQFGLDDNPQLDPRERKELEVKYGYRPTLRARFVLGLWEQDTTDGHFSDVWDESIHVLGHTNGPKEDWEMLVPTVSCTSLLCGWDVGESCNHSFSILEKIMTEDTKSRRRVISFSVIDELVVIRKQVSIEQFTEAALAKMEHWEAFHKKRTGIQLRWRHWSDPTASNYSSRSNTTDEALIYEASDGKISVNGAPKYRNSNRDKVKLLWQLLYHQRLHVSAQLASTRAMFANLRSGGDAEYVKDDDHKHPFDTVSYPILAEAPTDMMVSGEISTEKKDSSPRLTVVGG